AEVAAIFHDYAKCRAISEMEEIIKSEDLPKDLLCYNKELWHAQTAGIKIQLEYDLHSGQFLNFQIGPGKNNDKTFGTECLDTL
ncbi:transposase, partial [Bacillus cereus]